MDLKVSVIVPIYNAAVYLREAVLSACLLEEVLEVLLVDDLSTDNSLAVAEGLSSEFKKVKVIPNLKKRYAAGCRNLAIKEAKGQLIAFLDADDWYFPRRFIKDIEIFSSNPRAKITYSYSEIHLKYEKILPFGERSPFFKYFKDEDDAWGIYSYVIKNDLVLGNVNTITVRVEVFNNGFLWDERLVIHEDTEFWWRLSRKFRFYPAELNKPVSALRNHGNNSSSRSSFKTKALFLIVWIDNLGLGNLKDFEKEAIVYQLARSISNPIRNNFIRKSVFHAFRITVDFIDSIFIVWFYKWGMKRYNLLEKE
ncbi:glycosyltransferase family 2 protein [Litoribacter ruber]|uniref:glycosyltransferase family 2 protein n=1 Tax=Litoribacter ruber TaxID=702568 RepID=UPI001BDA1ECF|nr:glycosyltransferase family 2 protein [Litoribacter ruber]MBT0813044.1 glycosyltransferase family 2 protein [Litoribacter ruber]